MNRIEPSPTEKDKAIQAILSKGLTKSKSLWEHLWEIYRALGIRYIFFDTSKAIVISVASMPILIMLYPFSPEQYIYSTLFAVAPVFFIFIVLLAETIERVNGLYELKMTCKYTVQQIAAFRVLCFSLLGAAGCILISLYFSRLSVTYDFVRAFSLSLCDLFLCAFLSLFMMRRFNGKWTHFFAMLLWMATGFLPLRFFGQPWELFLSRIPVALTVFVAVIASFLFLMELKRWLNIRKREVAYYVSC